MSPVASAGGEPPESPTCSDLAAFGGSLLLVCQGCLRQATFSAEQARTKFGDDADQAAVLRRLKCGTCGRRGRTDASWFRAEFCFPHEVWFTPEELADQQAAADFDARQRSQFAGVASGPTPRRHRR